MNCKLEKFWNKEVYSATQPSVNMNCKLEKFWNELFITSFNPGIVMNCKLEKFWNNIFPNISLICVIWTVNLKSFEILMTNLKHYIYFLMNCKLEKFWNKIGGIAAIISFGYEL